jgi:uncharacterized damage-inducible protein DinB
MRGKTDPPVATLLHVLDEAYDKNAWHGQNLKGALRGVTARQAAWRPAAGRHNIRELVVHAAYWKSRVRHRLTGQKHEPFALAGSNWFTREGASEKAWKAERELLDREHRQLRRAAAGFPPARLTRRLPGTQGRTALREIAGIALHDTYHTAQIQLLRVLQRRKRGR